MPLLHRGHRSGLGAMRNRLFIHAVNPVCRSAQKESNDANATVTARNVTEVQRFSTPLSHLEFAAAFSTPDGQASYRENRRLMNAIAPGDVGLTVTTSKSLKSFLPLEGRELAGQT